jgi:zinc protease
MFAQAMQIGRAHNAGLPADSAELMLRKLEAVTADQVQAVARKYFVGDNLTVATLRPQPLAAVGR